MMNSITRKTPVLWFALCCLGMSAQAASGLTPWVLKADSLLLSSGTTYRYTVDTPEGEGLVSTLPSVTDWNKKCCPSGTIVVTSRTGYNKRAG